MEYKIRNDYIIAKKNNKFCLFNKNYSFYEEISKIEYEILKLMINNDYYDFYKIIYEMKKEQPKLNQTLEIIKHNLSFLFVEKNLNMNFKENFNKISHVNDSNRMPKYLFIFLTEKCDKKCIYCYNYGKEENVSKFEIDLNIAKNVVKQAYFLGIKNILLTGGEPLMYTYINELVSYISDLGIEISILSKGNISNEFLKRVDKNKLDFTFSMDSLNEIIVEEILGAKNALNIFYQDIEILKKNKIEFNISSVICNRNINNYIKDLEKFLKFKPNKIIINEVEISKNNRHNNINVEDIYFDKFRLRVEEYLLKNKINNVNYVKRKSSIMEKCSFGRTRIGIYLDGSVIPCEKIKNKFDLGNVKKLSLYNIWNSDEIYNYIYPKMENYEGTVCYDCLKFNNCDLKNICYYRSFNETGNFYNPIVEVENVCNKTRL